VSDNKEFLEEDQAVQLTSDLEAVIMDFLGLTQPLAAPFAQALVDGMRSRMGGKRIYVPAPRLRKQRLADAAQRDRDIAAMFNGRNVKDVMKHFACGRATVYRAVKRYKP